MAAFFILGPSLAFARCRSGITIADHWLRTHRHRSLVAAVSPFMARLRHADWIERCPSLRAKRKTSARAEFFSV